MVAGVQRPGSFVLLSGPAGFGKTTLLSELVAQLERFVAWVSLDEGDNDPIQFWNYLIAACQSIHSELGETSLALLQAPQPLPDETIPALLINDIVQLQSDLVVVLDDYHTIQNTVILKGIPQTSAMGQSLDQTNFSGQFDKLYKRATNQDGFVQSKRARR